MSTVEQLAAGTYIEVTAWQNSGAALDITAANVVIMQVSL
jgi:hypothetical protein